MSPNARDGAVAVLVFVVIVAVIVGGTAVLGTLAVMVTPTDETEPRTYDTAALYLERIPAEGDIEVARQDPGVIAIDRAHANAFDERELRELTRAITLAGHEVKFVNSQGAFPDVLNEADALIIIDPEMPYAESTVDNVEAFAEAGGHVLLVGQPDRLEIDVFVLVERESQIDTVANRFGVSFGTDYLYDMEANDGNFRNIVTESTGHQRVADVDSAVLYTSTHVSAADGEPLLVTSDSAQRSQTGTAGEYVVATQAGNAIAVGDANFLYGERVNVADNNVFIASIITFLGEGEAPDDPTIFEEEEPDDPPPEPPEEDDPPFGG